MAKIFNDANNASCMVGNERDASCLGGKNISLVEELGLSTKYTDDKQDIIYGTNTYYQQLKLLVRLVERMQSLIERSETNKTDCQIVFSRLLAESQFLAEQIECEIIAKSNKSFKSKKHRRYIEWLINIQTDVYKIINFLDKNILDNSMHSIIGSRSILALSSKMIQKQGLEVNGFLGTCGLCSIVNATNNLGARLTEKKLIKVAIAHNWCECNSIPSENGGTDHQERESILQYFGYICESKKKQSLEEILTNLKSGKEGIISIHTDVLETHISGQQKQPTITNHVVTIIDVETDKSGMAIGLWIHDTGIHSDMGNLFFCNVNSYEFWKNTHNNFVQYISK
jgi:hypothetical protein